MNLYAYVGNNPLNATDPTGMDTQVELKGYPLDKVPDGEGNGHMFVQATDTVTGESVIARGGPSGDYMAQTGSSPVDDVVTRDSNGLTLEANVSDAASSIDFGQPGEELIDSVTITNEFADVVQGLEDYASNTNNADVPYSPLGPNSNTFATSAFRSTTGQTANRSKKSYTYPGAAWRNPADPSIKVPTIGVPACNACP
jgi:hypothetical protein